MDNVFIIKRKKYCKGSDCFFYIVYFMFFIALVTISGFRLLGPGRDDINYLSKEQYLENFTILNFIIQEPTYWLILSFSKYILNNITLQFLPYTIIHIGILFFVIKRYSINIGISLLTYLSFFFLLHGYTQIRVSAAISIFLFSIHYLLLEKRLKYIIGILTSISFHYSSIIYLAFLFLKKNKINRYFYFILPILGVLLGIISNKIGLEKILYKLYFPDFINFRLIRSLEYNITSKANLINTFVMFKLLIYWISLLKINYMYKINKYSILYIKILGWSIFAFYVLLPAPVLAFRISEMLSSILILLIPIFVKIFKEEFIIKILLIILGVFVMIKSYYYLILYQGL